VPNPPPRVRLARLPTPVEQLERWSGRLGVEIWCKRDDLTGADLSGNKVRKLEFLLADALDRGARTVVTCGGEQSNHARATALACARLGLRSVLLLRTADPAAPPATEGNLLLDCLAGAEIRWITPAQYRDRAELLRAAAAEVERGYVVPEGGSNALGAWGYVACIDELLADVPRPFTVVAACGSGGTAAGLLLGRALRDARDVRCVAVNVCDDAAYFAQVIGGILAEAGRPDAAGALEIQDGYVGLGYARSRPEEIRLLEEVARGEGLVLDPVYTGKAFFAMTREIAADRRRFGERVVFLHTGGIFGLLTARTADLLGETSPA
jgi:D-cysteine desulfhydrase